MILEAIVTTLSAEGVLNVAPMGPLLSGPLEEGFVLRPFETSTTLANLQRQPEGVLHVTDDALLLAQAAIGRVDPEPATFPAARVQGRVLADACRWVEFEVVEFDAHEPRATLRCQVVAGGHLRDHFGFNRAKHAVVEAAILATRVHLIGHERILQEFEPLEVIVNKTGGPRECQAMELLRQYVGSSPQ